LYYYFYKINLVTGAHCIIIFIIIKNIIICLINIIIFIIIKNINIINSIICIINIIFFIIINIINKIINKFEKKIIINIKKMLFLYYKCLQYFLWK
jgi:hypothetical protein